MGRWRGGSCGEKVLFSEGLHFFEPFDKKGRASGSMRIRPLALSAPLEERPPASPSQRGLWSLPSPWPAVLQVFLPPSLSFRLNTCFKLPPVANEFVFFPNSFAIFLRGLVPCPKLRLQTALSWWLWWSEVHKKYMGRTTTSRRPHPGGSHTTRGCLLPESIRKRGILRRKWPHEKSIDSQ